MQKIIIFICALVLVIFFLCKNLNPMSAGMFEFHDETQAARVDQFTLSLQHMQIPPRLAPDLSFHMGYPVFNFYAPFSYWVTSFLHLTGLDIISALKLSFILTIAISFIGCFLFLKNHFSFYPSIGGSILYSSSLYFAIDIFIRGNIAETWFLSLLPLSLYFVYKNSFTPDKWYFIGTVCILSATLTVHNLLSLVFIPLLIGYIFLLKNRRRNFISLFLAFLMSAYFYIPLLLESHLTYATNVAAKTDYHDHFLCIRQLWDSTWGFGGSAPECEFDGMPFRIGKPQIVIFLLGILLLLFNLYKKNKLSQNIFVFFFIFTTLFSLFLTLYPSQFIWDLFHPVSSLMQFPWRFISFSIIGIAFISTYFYESLPLKIVQIGLVIIISLFTLFSHSKYFYRQTLSNNDYVNKYISQKYIAESASYSVSEYLPKTADYNFWQQFNNAKTVHKEIPFDYMQPIQSDNKQFTVTKNDPFYKEILINNPSSIFLNIHYFPFWRITINNKMYIPTKFDKLGRPIITINKPTNIIVQYKQTTTEVIANMISILTFISSMILIVYKPLWKKFMT